MISCCLQSNDGWILHGECRKPRKSKLRASSAIKAAFKRPRVIIDRFSDIGIATKVGNAAFAFKEFRMESGTERMVFGKFFRMGNRADVPQPDFAPVKHLKTGDTNEATLKGKMRVIDEIDSEIIESGKCFEVFIDESL